MHIFNVKVGDSVYIDCYTSLGGGVGWDKIKEVKTVFEKETGNPYKIIKVDNHWYRIDTGVCDDSDKWMYYIDTSMGIKKIKNQ